MPRPRRRPAPATDAKAMLRILFSRLGQPHIGSPNAFSFNGHGPGREISVEVGSGGKKTKGNQLIG